jgi:hypothetical protein
MKASMPMRMRFRRPATDSLPAKASIAGRFLDKL